MGNGKILDFSSIEHFFCSFALNMFISTNIDFTGTFSFSSIEHFLFIPTSICSMELINEMNRILLEF